MNEDEGVEKSCFIYQTVIINVPFMYLYKLARKLFITTKFCIPSPGNDLSRKTRRSFVYFVV